MTGGGGRRNDDDWRGRFVSPMPIDQPRLRKLTPEHIKNVAGRLKPGKVQSWSTTVEGKRFPVKQLVREAAASLGGNLPPLSEGTTAHEAVCVLSHNGFTSRNESWGGGASIQVPASPGSPSDNDQLYGYILALRTLAETSWLSPCVGGSFSARWGAGSNAPRPTGPEYAPSGIAVYRVAIDEVDNFISITILRVIVRHSAHALIEQAGKGSGEVRNSLIDQIESVRVRRERAEGGNKTVRDAELAELQTFIYDISAGGQGRESE